MRQSRNLKVTLLAVAISLIASACAIGGGQATGGQEVIVASESGVENDEDNSLSLGFRPQAEDAATTSTSSTTTTTTGSTTTSTNSTTSRSSITQAPAAPSTNPTTTRTPAIALTTTVPRTPASVNPTTAPTTAATTTTEDDPTIGRNENPVFLRASTALTGGLVVTRARLECHESWGEIEVKSTLFEVQGSRLVNIGEESRKVPCDDGLSHVQNTNVNNPHGFDTRIIFEDIPNLRNGELATYRVQMQASVPSRPGLSAKTRVSEPFIQLFHNISLPNVAPDGWEYFG